MGDFLDMRLDTTDLSRLVRNYSGDGLGRKLSAGLDEGGALVEARARATAPVGATQMVRGSHYHKPISVQGAPANEIGVSAPHAIVVHEGRKPGRMPPTDALVPWLRFKGIDESAAFPIARAIAQKGTKGRPWLREAFDKAMDQIVSIVARHLGGS